MLSWVDVRAMQGRGTIAFGGHTRSHANLRAMKDPYAEIRACYEDILRIGGFKPAGFCYPYGQYNEQTPSAVAKAGFITAVTCVDGAVETGPDLKLLELPRVSIMGGIHRYHAEHVAASQPGSLAVRVWKEGRPMELRPRLVWSNHASRPDEGWLSRVLIADQPVMLTWTLPVPELSGAPVLELWDNLRVMKMFQTPLKP
jgi:peptidoglycan/xylan/chitin deacetylase (PgdA/CDA1 family)